MKTTRSETNWFGMSKHPTDEYVPPGLKNSETQKFAEKLCAKYDFLVSTPELKKTLDSLLEMVEQEGFDRGSD